MSSNEPITGLTIKYKPCSAVNYEGRCAFSARKFFKDKDGFWYPLCMPHYKNKVMGKGLSVERYAPGTGLTLPEKTAWLAARKRKLKERFPNAK